MRYYLTQDHFHYDDSGYYGYILFSGTNAELHDLLKALGRGEKPHGFGWHRWGRSFRPANNGVVYDFYIRLRSKTGEKPSEDSVDAFLKKVLSPREILTGEADRQQTEEDAPRGSVASAPSSASDDPPRWANNFLSHVEAMYLKNVDSLTQKMAEELLQLRSDIGEISEARREINHLQASLEQTRTELEAKEMEIATLRNSPRAASYDKQMQEDRDKAEKAAKNLRDEIKKLRQEKNHQIFELKAALKEAETERDNWKQQFEDMSGSFAEPNDDEASIAEEGGNFENDLTNIVEGAFPQLELLHNSLERLPRAPHFRPIMKLLHDVQARKLRGERIPNSDWSEVRFSKSWRLYFCNKSGLPNDKKLALIGNKNTQRGDLRWLKANPPESCL